MRTQRVQTMIVTEAEDLEIRSFDAYSIDPVKGRINNEDEDSDNETTDRRKNKRKKGGHINNEDDNWTGQDIDEKTVTAELNHYKKAHYSTRSKDAIRDRKATSYKVQKDGEEDDETLGGFIFDDEDDEEEEEFDDYDDVEMEEHE